MPVLSRHEPLLKRALAEAFGGDGQDPIGSDLDADAAATAGNGDKKAAPFVWVRRSPYEPKVGGGGRPLGAWALADQPEAAERPLLLVFVLGGASHSELRCAREIAAAHPTRELILGSSAILTPSDFLEALQQVPPPQPLAEFDF